MGAAAQGRIDHVASEHTLDTTHAAVPPVGSANQLHVSHRPKQSHPFAARQTGVRRKISIADPIESGARRHEHAPTAITQASLQASVAALDFSSDAILILDRTGVVQYANRACLSLLARERRDVGRDVGIQGRHVLGLVCLPGNTLRNILRALRHSTTWNGTVQLELGARYRAIDLCVCRVPGRGGRIQSFSLIARPARTSPQASAPDTDQASSADVLSTIARVASEMAHDFNNQLAVVLNYSFILLRELPSCSPMRGHVTELQGAAWRAAEVAREILRFGAKRCAEASEIDMHRLLGTTQLVLGTMLGGGHTKVELRLAADGCKVLARRAHLEWLLFELSARLQSRLGRLSSLRISTSTAVSGDKPEDGSSRDSTRLLIALDAHGANPAHGNADSLLAETEQTGASGMQGLRAAERTLEHTRGELTVHLLPDGGLRYLLCLPAHA